MGWEGGRGSNPGVVASVGGFGDGPLETGTTSSHFPPSSLYAEMTSL